MCYVMVGGGLKIGKIEKIGNGFACYGRTGGAMMNGPHGWIQRIKWVYLHPQKES